METVRVLLLVESNLEKKNTNTHLWLCWTSPKRPAVQAKSLKRRASPQKKHCQDKWSAYRFTPKLACMYQQFTDGKHGILDSSLFPFGRERKKGREVYFGLEINEFDNMMS